MIPRKITKEHIALFACIVLIGLLLRCAQLVQKSTLLHDEARSYLTATANDGRYSRQANIYQPSSPFGEWSPASDWHTFYEISEPFTFRQIATDLARHDLHPPLYFWLLHLWCLVVGVHIYTGPILNLFLALASTLCLAGLARSLSGSWKKGVLVAGVWALSPATLAISYEARPYDLLAFLTILFVWQVVAFNRSSQIRRRHLLGLIALTALGLLTNFYFGLALLAGVGMILCEGIQRGRQDGTNAGRRHVAWGAAVLLLGVAMFYLIFPGSVSALSIQFRGVTHSALNGAGILQRAQLAWATILGFFLPWDPRHALHGSQQILLAVLTGVAAAAALFAVIRTLRRRGQHLPAADIPWTFIALPLWLILVPAALYCLNLSPAHAMGPKYLSIGWPFLAFLPLIPIRSWSRRLSVALIVVMALFGTLGAWRTIRQDRSYPNSNAILFEADTILVDSVQKSVLPRVIWYLPADAALFAAPQKALETDADSWLDRLCAGGLYISDLQFGGDDAAQARIIGQIEARCAIAPAESDLFGGQQVFVVGDAGSADE